MSVLLRLDASIRGDLSISRRLTGQLVERLSSVGTTVISRDLSEGVPAIDGKWLGAVFTPAEDRSLEQAEIAHHADTLLDEVRRADTLVIGLPIYNFGVPANLKNWFDQLARKGETFQYTDAGPEGLIKGKKAYIVLSSDGTEIGGPVDFASGYVRHMLGFFGITDVTFVAADKLVFGADEVLARAENEIKTLAA